MLFDLQSLILLSKVYQHLIDFSFRNQKTKQNKNKMILFFPFALLFVTACIFFIRLLLYKTGLVYIVKKWWRLLEDCFHVYQTFKVPEFNVSEQDNQLYRRVTDYLNSLASIEDSDFTNLITGKKPNEIVLKLDANQRVEDEFFGAKLVWLNEKKDQEPICRCWVLKIRKADRRRVLKPYIQHIHTIADEFEQTKSLKLYMNFNETHHQSGLNQRWRSVPFSHPSTFETITMEADLKAKLKSDLESFLKSQQYYHRLGRVWKRSYLLYGPSGTGKTSFVAAMANFLCFDVYDLDLSKVANDSDLEMLSLQTTRKSVVVIEDLDRFLMEKSTAVSLSGVLNFMDGLLNSCCTEERVMVFTVNGKDNIDPAILRPGRIDVHIHFPLCDFVAFKILASNYLGVKDHKLFPQVEEKFQTGSSLSPAEIGELMIANRNSPSRAIKSVITALQTDGDGRGTGKIGRLLDGHGSRKSVEDPGESCRVLRSEGLQTVDIKKFYRFLGMKSNREPQSFDAIQG